MPEVVLRARLGGVAVHGAGRRQHEPPHTRAAHGLEHVVRDDRTLLEVETRVLEAVACLGVRGKVKDRVVPFGGASERVEIQGVGLDDLRAAARQRSSDELAAPHGEVVEQRDRAAL